MSVSSIGGEWVVGRSALSEYCLVFSVVQFGLFLSDTSVETAL